MHQTRMMQAADSWLLCHSYQMRAADSWLLCQNYHMWWRPSMGYPESLCLRCPTGSCSRSRQHGRFWQQPFQQPCTKQPIRVPNAQSLWLTCSTWPASTKPGQPCKPESESGYAPCTDCCKSATTSHEYSGWTMNIHNCENMQLVDLRYYNTSIFGLQPGVDVRCGIALQHERLFKKAEAQQRWYILLLPGLDLLTQAHLGDVSEVSTF